MLQIGCYGGALRIENRKEKMMFLLLLVGMLILLLVALVHNYYKTSNYVSVEAELIKVVKEAGDTNDTDMMIYKTAIYRFDLDNVTYTASKNVMFISSSSVGKRYHLRCDPANPTVLEDTAKMTTSILVIIVLLFASALLVMDIFRKK